MPTAPTTAAATTWVEVDLEDAEIVVKEHADGLFTIDVNADQPLVVNAEQMQGIVRAFTAFGKAKRWGG